MKVSIKALLLPDKDEYQKLYQTFKDVNNACNKISEFVWSHKIYTSRNLIKHYQQLKTILGENISGQKLLQIIYKVAQAYRIDNNNSKVTFDNFCPLNYNRDLLRFDQSKNVVSLWTTLGRVHVHFKMDHPEGLQMETGSYTLVYWIDEDTFFILIETFLVHPTPEQIKIVLQQVL
jgi:hypothetical protein